MNYTQLSEEERHRIGALRSEGRTMSCIARRLGRSCSTISRELKRNRYPTDGMYRAYHAASMARGRRSRARCGSRFGADDWKYVEALLRCDWSPEQVAGERSIPGHSGALADAISDRQLTFTGPTALKFVFDGVKVSVKGQYGQSSPQYQTISGLSW